MNITFLPDGTPICTPDINIPLTRTLTGHSLFEEPIGINPCHAYVKYEVSYCPCCGGSTNR